MPSGAFQGLAVSVQGFWECEGDGEPGQLTGPALGPPAHARDVQGWHQCRLMSGLEEKEMCSWGKKTLALHAHLGLELSLRTAAIFRPSIFCLGFHRPVQLPKHIFCCYLICKRFFIPLSSSHQATCPEFCSQTGQPLVVFLSVQSACFHACC